MICARLSVRCPLKRRSRSISALVSFGNILSSRGSNPGMAHPLEFNTIQSERSAESVQPRAAPVKAGINLPNCNFALSLWSRMECVTTSMKNWPAFCKPPLIRTHLKAYQFQRKSRLECIQLARRPDTT